MKLNRLICFDGGCANTTGNAAAAEESATKVETSSVEDGADDDGVG